MSLSDTAHSAGEEREPTDIAATMRPAIEVNASGKFSAQCVKSIRAHIQSGQAEIIALFLRNHDAFGAIAALTHQMDTLLSSLFGALLKHRSDRGKATGGVAVIAAGGYGRRDLFLHSDIDLLFLYAGKERDIKTLCEPILYLLWDLGLSVGHRVLPLDAVRGQLEDQQFLSNLLDARLVAGDNTLADALHEMLRQERTPGNIHRFLSAKMLERNERHLRGGDSRYLLEPNIKDGKGGLRDLHTLYWMARFAYDVAGVRGLLGHGMLTDAEYRRFRKARHFLSVIRLHLHILAGRAEERLTFDAQRRIAEALGYRGKTPNASVERFMRHYFRIARDVGYLTGVFCSIFEEEQKYHPRIGFNRLWGGKQRAGVFSVWQNRLMLEDEKLLCSHPVTFLEIFATAARQRLDVHPKTLQLISRHLHLIDDRLRKDREANALFLSLLLDITCGVIALKGLNESGVLGKFIPEFAHIIGQMQFDMYHIYTTDEHTLVAIGTLHAIEHGDLRRELPLTTDLLPRLDSRRVLYLALLCHDIAKGKGGRHEERGAEVARALAERFGFSGEEQEMVAWLVRHHALYSHTAFQRDLSDPATLASFMEKVRSLEKLRLLLALTVADIRAVGPTVWNGWKGALMRELYTRAVHYIETGNYALPYPDIEALDQALHAPETGLTHTEILHYLDQGFPAYWSSRPAEEHATVARLLREAEENPGAFAVETSADEARATTLGLLVAPDRRGLLADVAGAISRSGANILGARVFTLKHGWAVQTWLLQDAAKRPLDARSGMPRLRRELNTMFTASGTPPPLPSYPSWHKKHNHFAIAGQVFINNGDSETCTIIEVDCMDSPGLLHAICRALHEAQINIASAHINTYGERAVDVFYVKDSYGFKITRESRQEQLRADIAQAIAAL